MRFTLLELMISALPPEMGQTQTITFVSTVLYDM